MSACMNDYALHYVFHILPGAVWFKCFIHQGLSLLKSKIRFTFAIYQNPGCKLHGHNPVSNILSWFFALFSYF